MSENRARFYGGRFSFVCFKYEHRFDIYSAFCSLFYDISDASVFYNDREEINAKGITTMKRWFLLLVAIIAFLGFITKSAPERGSDIGSVTVMVVSVAEEPQILEGITEEMLIDQIISEKKQSYDEKQSRSKIGQAFFLKTLSKNGE